MKQTPAWQSGEQARHLGKDLAKHLARSVAKRAGPAVAFACVAMALALTPRLALAQSSTPGDSAVEWVLVIGAASLVPLLLVMTTAFIKSAVVLGVLRNAFGVQGIPPALVVTGLAVLLTIYIMAPVGAAIAERVETLSSDAEGDAGVDPDSGQPPEPGLWDRFDSLGDDEQDAGSAQPGAAQLASLVLANREYVLEPMRVFLSTHAHASDVALFIELGPHNDSGEAGYSADDILVLAPAFALSELKEAFQIGFLILLPFLIIDLVIGSILMSLGMHMVNPTGVSLTFKLLLFVIADGWVLLVHGLIYSYQGVT